jgi:nitroreductase
VAVKYMGYAGNVAVLPDPSDPDLVASVGLGHARTPDDHDQQLFAAIDRRHTHRSAFEARPVPDDLLAALGAAADNVGVTLYVILDEETKQQAAALVAEGDRRQMADPRFRQELTSWVRSNYSRRGDGMPGYAFGIPGLPSLVGALFLRTIDMGRRQAVRDAELAATAPALLLLTTPEDGAAEWVATGRALGTLLLTAAAAGLATSFLNQPIETSAFRPKLAGLVDSTGAQPQLLLRLGYPSTHDRPTPRRPVKDLLASPDGT